MTLILKMFIGVRFITFFSFESNLPNFCFRLKQYTVNLTYRTDVG